MKVTRKGHMRLIVANEVMAFVSAIWGASALLLEKAHEVDNFVTAYPAYAIWLSINLVLAAAEQYLFYQHAKGRTQQLWGQLPCREPINNDSGRSRMLQTGLVTRGNANGDVTEQMDSNIAFYYPIPQVYYRNKCIATVASLGLIAISISINNKVYAAVMGFTLGGIFAAAQLVKFVYLLQAMRSLAGVSAASALDHVKRTCKIAFADSILFSALSVGCLVGGAFKLAGSSPGALAFCNMGLLIAVYFYKLYLVMGGSEANGDAPDVMVNGVSRAQERMLTYSLRMLPPAGDNLRVPLGVATTRPEYGSSSCSLA